MGRSLSVAAVVLAVLTAAGCSGGSAGTPAAPSAASTWRSVTGLPKSLGGSLQSIVYDGSGFVAVGDHSPRGPGLVWTSSDGATWQDDSGSAALATFPLHAVTRGATGVLAIGNDCGGAGECGIAGGKAFLSADDAAWTPGGTIGADEEPAGQAIWSGSTYVAVGQNDDDNPVFAGRIWTSKDGMSWKQVLDDAIFETSQVTGIAANQAGLVAVGGARAAAGGSAAAVWVSSDGTTWSRVPDQPAFADSKMAAVTAAGPGFVAVGKAGTGAAVWTSPDGQAWTRVADGPAFAGAAMYGVTGGSAGLAAVGFGGSSAAIWTSPDGLTWTRVPDLADFAKSQAVSVAAHGATFVAVGRGSPAGIDQAFVWVNQ